MSITAFKFARSANHFIFTGATPEQLDLIPEGFNNSVRWNFGHVLVIADRVLSLTDHYTTVLPERYTALFNMGTSPKDWDGDIPSLEELVDYSSKQLTAAANLYEQHGTETLAKPFNLRGTEFHTVVDLLAFLSFHEGAHYEKSKILATITK